MRGRGKAIISDSFADPPLCRKHPSASSVGICALCLKDRLIKLVCSDCGEPRLSSCSCSDVSNRNSVSVDIGAVGPISFLIHNEPQTAAAEKRSGFWHLGCFSDKKLDPGADILGRKSDVTDRRREIWDFDHLDASGSCSWEAKRKSTSSFCGERDDAGLDDGDSEFFDLNFGRFSVDAAARLDDGQRGRGLSKGSPCRVTVKERGVKGGKRGSKVWKWIFSPSKK